MPDTPAANRRKEERLPVLQSIYVVVDTHPQVMGQMVEISSTGMAFTFVDLDAVSQKLKDSIRLRVDLFEGGQGYLIRNLPCRLVSKTSRAAASSFSSLTVKRIGLEFQDVSLPQQVQINTFLRKHAKTAQNPKPKPRRR
jgi:c-di-GMP-binding flagellar brake protein YcgR